MLQTLSTHRINTLTELCRIERTAASCEDEEDARAFQQPMTAAWNHYVTSNQLLTELRGLTVNYPISSDILQDAQIRVRNDPQSNRSWNMAWLCLTRIRDDGLIVFYASLEAARPEMWGDMTPSADDLRQLATCFEREWVRAVDRMLQHWMTPPAWY